MDRKLCIILLAVFISGPAFAFTDNLWIVGGQGCPGRLIPVQVWLQYEGGGVTDSMIEFDILLTWDAAVCSVESYQIAQEFVDAMWVDYSEIDNQGTMGPPAVPKIGLISLMMSAFAPIPRGTHLAATVDFRILDTATSGDSTCIDTLMEGFSPSIYLGYVDKGGIITYIPSFSTDCISVVECSCGDCNGDGRITGADATYILGYIYRGGTAPIGQGDVNLDGRITGADATYIITYIYRGGPPPCEPPSGSTSHRDGKRMVR